MMSIAKIFIAQWPKQNRSSVRFVRDGSRAGGMRGPHGITFYLQRGPHCGGIQIPPAVACGSFFRRSDWVDRLELHQHFALDRVADETVATGTVVQFAQVLFGGGFAFKGHLGVQHDARDRDLAFCVLL